MEGRVLSLLHYAPTQLLDDPIVREDPLDHGASPWYGGTEGKSMSANELIQQGKVNWRKITPTIPEG